jgi:hypothetical protein
LKFRKVLRNDRSVMIPAIWPHPAAEILSMNHLLVIIFRNITVRFTHSRVSTRYVQMILDRIAVLVIICNQSIARTITRMYMMNQDTFCVTRTRFQMLRTRKAPLQSQAETIGGNRFA